MSTLALIAPNQASATTTYNLIKTSSFPASPASGWHTCQSKYVTLPKLASTDRYAWSEEYPDGNGDGITAYGQTFSGKFYWTVCISSMTGISSYWTYQEYSILTLVTSACTTLGHCTTYYLQHHYIRDTAGGSKLWGSQLFVRPASWCYIEACENQASVTVEKT
jgi:hypothetical protein